VRIASRAPTLVPANPFSASYLEAKRLRMGHSLPSLLDGGLDGSVSVSDAE
jgi:hypothetical protein